jgi:hypothetical protein
MREGFRTEEWVVKRTPINTPVAASDENKMVVGMINLSDEDEDDEDDEDGDQTSLHLDSEAVFKSGATTPPGGANEDDSMRSSLVPSSLGGETSVAQAAQPEVHDELSSLAQVPEELSRRDDVEELFEKLDEGAKTPVEELEPIAESPPKMQAEAAVIPIVRPPMGFDDSPQKARQQLPGQHQRQILQQEEEKVEEVISAEKQAGVEGAKVSIEISYHLSFIRH